MRICAWLALVIVSIAAVQATAEHQQPAAAAVPGVVIAHSPASSQVYIGSAGLVRLSDGTYLAKHDEFGKGSTEHVSAVTRVYRSTDRGQTWAAISEINGLFWSNIFEHRGAVFMIGTHHHHGPLVVYKSLDQGTIWSTPQDSKTGLIREGKWHTAPVPIVVHNGRLWRAVEDGDGPPGWGLMYRPRVMSIPMDGDLLDADQWTITDPIQRDDGWLGGTFRWVLEGNVVVDLDGVIRNILRSDQDELAAVTTISAGGRSQTIDSAFDRAKLPGSSKKLLIRWDEPSQHYWALSNPPLPGSEAKGASGGAQHAGAVQLGGFAPVDDALRPAAPSRSREARFPIPGLDN